MLSVKVKFCFKISITFTSILKEHEFNASAMGHFTELKTLSKSSGHEK